MKANGKIALSWTEPDGSSTRIEYRTRYLEAATHDAFNSLYRALGMTEFIWMGEPEQDDIDRLRNRYGLS